MAEDRTGWNYVDPNWKKPSQGTMERRMNKLGRILSENPDLMSQIQDVGRDNGTVPKHRQVIGATPDNFDHRVTNRIPDLPGAEDFIGY